MAARPRTKSESLIRLSAPSAPSAPSALSAPSAPSAPSANDAHDSAVTVDAHELTRLDALGGLPGADDGRHTVFPGDDRGVRHRPADVGNGRLDLPEHRSPARRGHRADENLALADLADVIHIPQHASDALDHPRRGAVTVDLILVDGVGCL